MDASQKHSQKDTNRLWPIHEWAERNVEKQKEGSRKKKATQCCIPGALSWTHREAKDERICSSSARSRIVSQGAPPKRACV